MTKAKTRKTELQSFWSYYSTILQNFKKIELKVGHLTRCVCRFSFCVSHGEDYYFPSPDICAGDISFGGYNLAVNIYCRTILNTILHDSLCGNCWATFSIQNHSQAIHHALHRPTKRRSAPKWNTTFISLL